MKGKILSTAVAVFRDERVKSNINSTQTPPPPPSSTPAFQPPTFATNLHMPPWNASFSKRNHFHHHNHKRNLLPKKFLNHTREGTDETALKWLLPKKKTAEHNLEMVAALLNFCPYILPIWTETQQQRKQTAQSLWKENKLSSRSLKILL